ncbi:MAG: hypothetical protein ACYTGQ_20285, partial [Planctomycetota bacterium]
MRGRLFVAVLLGVTVAGGVVAHEHEPITHTFKMESEAVGPRFTLNIVDAETGQPIAARFSVEVDGQTHVPDWVSDAGVRFTSSHFF